jgi:hypothetical protein
MGIIKRNFLASFVAITIAALFSANTDAAQWSAPRPGKSSPNSGPGITREVHPPGPTRRLSELPSPHPSQFEQDSSGLISLTPKNLASATWQKPNDSPAKLKTDALDRNALRSLQTTENWDQGPDPAWGSVNPHDSSYARQLKRLLEAERGPYWRIAE